MPQAAHNPDWEVTPEELQQLLHQSNDAFALIDVRHPDEHALARIPGSVLIPLPQLQAQAAELAEALEGKTIVTHCHLGMRSLKAAAILRSVGLHNTKSLAGGIDAWQAHLRTDRQTPENAS